jgi:predicted nucleotidyltransferase
MSEHIDRAAATIDWQRAKPVWEETPQLIAAWAFGSARSGRVSSGSDLDVAVWFDSLPSFDDQMVLLARLQAALQFEDIDLVVLNDANPILRFEAVCGQPLFCRDPGLCAGFASLTAREYEDELAFWQRALHM